MLVMITLFCFSESHHLNNRFYHDIVNQINKLQLKILNWLSFVQCLSLTIDNFTSDLILFIIGIPLITIIVLNRTDHKKLFAQNLENINKVQSYRLANAFINQTIRLTHDSCNYI